MNNYAPQCWGSIMWNMLHIISFSYPEYVSNSLADLKLKQDTFNFFKLLGTMLPCEDCRLHYNQNFNSLNLSGSLGSREQLTKFVYDLHNLVNKELGIPKNQWPSFEEVYKKYNNMRSNDCSSNACGSSSMKCKVEFVSNTEGLNIENFNGGGPIAGFFSGFILAIIIGIIIYYILKKNKKI